MCSIYFQFIEEKDLQKFVLTFCFIFGGAIWPMISHENQLLLRRRTGAVKSLFCL